MIWPWLMLALGLAVIGLVRTIQLDMRLDRLEQKQDRCIFCAVMHSQVGGQSAGGQQ